MTIMQFLSKKTIPALLAGMVFFMAGCQGKGVLEREKEPQVQPEAFVEAEEYRRNGQLHLALSRYEAYLESSPKGAKAPQAMQRMVEIHLELDQERAALDLFAALRKEFPDHEGIPYTHYEIVRYLYGKGELRGAEAESLKWLEHYASHPLREELSILLGDINERAGEEFRAFKRWIQALKALPDASERQGELAERLGRIIRKTEPSGLKALAGLAEGTDYAPWAHFRLARLRLETGNLGGARNAAFDLLRSTSDDAWLHLARDILERVHAERSVMRKRVGCLLPLSGPFGIYGQEVLNGILLALGVTEEGSRETDLELVIRDTGGTPEKTAAALHELVYRQRVIAVIGPLSSRSAAVAANEAQRMGVPLITLSQKEGIVDAGDMVFRNFHTPTREVKELLDTAMDSLGIRRFAILYPENSYGVLLMTRLWDGLEDEGGTVTAVESYPPEQTDFAEQIKKMTGLFYPRPESVTRRLKQERSVEEEESVIFPEEPQPIVDFGAVFLPDNAQHAAMIAPQLVYHDVTDVVLMGTGLWQSQDLMDMAGEYMQRAVFTSGFFEDQGNPVVRGFVNSYRREFDGAPSVLAATGYDTMMLLKEMLAGKEIRTRSDLRAALFRGRGIDGVTGKIAFDSRGEVKKEPLILTFRGNRMTVFR